MVQRIRHYWLTVWLLKELVSPGSRYRLAVSQPPF